ncbi:FAD binding domain-containing protein [Reyranella sp.]|uniref:FAD binding domain-containing protein n=1 Tax=Reyranella sp. TaxID=1929291 RepID=UPI003BAD26B0
MTPFQYVRATDVADAIVAAGGDPGTSYIAGGTNLLDLMKEKVARPRRLVDITRLPLDRIVERPDGGLSIGALVPNSRLAWHPLIEARYPLMSSALLAGASPQIRNMATTGGNLLQRTRCLYFYDPATPCNKRAPGSGCAAREGLNRAHAILGASEHCVAVHPSDLCVALAALGAEVRVAGPAGERLIPLTDFHRLPGDRPERDTMLEPGELVLAVELPPPLFPRHYTYLKLRDRLSFAFALVSVAVGLAMEGDTVMVARIALGGVAPRPWRVPAAEALLEGHRPARDRFAAAADALLEGARPLAHNGFKVDMARRAIVRALGQAAAATPQSQSDKRIA